MNIRTIGPIEYSEAQRQRFRNGELVALWKRRYPAIFDDDDIRLALSQPSAHFGEWLAAITIFNATGHLSLLEKYALPSHRRKLRLFEKVVPQEYRDLMDAHPVVVQSPDLFVYSEDRKDWYYCEVKVDSDRLRPKQIAFFERIMEITGRPVFSMEFKKAKR
jgi:hypothetical protein